MYILGSPNENVKILFNNYENAFFFLITKSGNQLLVWWKKKWILMWNFTNCPIDNFQLV